MSNIFKLSGALQIGSLASAPSGAKPGYMYYNTTEQKYYMYNGATSQFEQVGLDIVVNTLAGNETTKAASVAAVNAGISAEASSRESADSSLDAKISSETSARASADASLASQISSSSSDISASLSSEASTRAVADSSLTSRISSEEAARASADSSLSSRLSSEEAARSSADASLASDLSTAEASLDSKISSEVSSRESADSSLSSKISSEISARTSSDNVLAADLSAETSTRASADLVLDQKIDDGDASLMSALNSEASLRTSGDGSLATKISAEESARVSADSSLEAYISTSVGGGVAAEESARVSADASLNSKISSEISSRVSADASLEAYISTSVGGGVAAEESARVSADNSLDSKISSETSVRESAISSLSSSVDSSISSEVSSRESADSSLTSRVSSEEAARASADSSLDSKISSEESTRASADSSLDAKISSETARADSAELSLSGSIANVAADLSTETSSRVSADSSLTSRISVVEADLSSETTARFDADSSLTSRISSEESTRASADSSLDAKISSEESARASADISLATSIDTKVSKSGDTMSGNLAMGGNKVTGLANGVNANDAVTKAQLDSAVTGTTWYDPVNDVDLVDDSLSAPPTPSDKEVYIVASGATGDWAGLDGHAVFYNGSAWISLLGRPVAAGDRFGVAMEYGGTLGGSFVGKAKQIAQVVTVSPLVYAFTEPVSQHAVFVANENSFHFGHSYMFNGSTWVEFGGPGAIGAGTGLAWNGNTLNVQLGAGITELPSDQVGIDLRSDSGLMLTEDGSTDSTSAGAQLSLKLDGSTLSKTSSGVKVADGGISDAQVASGAGIAFSKMAALTASKVAVTDASGVLIASGITATELGYLTGLDYNVQEQLDSKISHLIEDPTPTLGGNLEINGKVIEGATSDIVLAGQNSVKRAKQASKASFVEEEYIHGISLSASQTDAVISDLSFAHATVEGVEITYKMKDSDGAVRIGTLRVATNGTDITVVDMFADSTDLNIAFSAAINGANVEIKYTSSSTTAVMRADVKKFLA